MLYRLDRLPYRWRAATFCLTAYMVAVGLLVEVGPVSQVYLVGFSVFTVILLGLRAGFCAAAAQFDDALCDRSSGSRGAETAVYYLDHDLTGWSVITLNFTFVNMLLTLAVGAVLRTLNAALQREVASGVSLELERALLRTLIDALPDLVFTKDADGRFTTGNRAMLNLADMAYEEQLVGKTDFDVFPRELAESYHADDMQVIAGRSLNNQEERCVDRAGNTIWYLTIKAPLRDALGAVVGLVGIARDVTDRKRAEADRVRLLAQLQLQIERMPLAYLLSEADLKYSRWNPMRSECLVSRRPRCSASIPST